MSHCGPDRPGLKVSAMNNTRILTLTAVVVVAALAPTTALAKHGGGDDVSARGSCTKSSSSKLKLSGDDGRIETEFEVDQNRNGVRWRVTLTRNGKRVVSTRATTRAPSGSFEIRPRPPRGLRHRPTGAPADPAGSSPRTTSPWAVISPKRASL